MEVHDQCAVSNALFIETVIQLNLKNIEIFLWVWNELHFNNKNWLIRYNAKIRANCALRTIRNNQIELLYYWQTANYQIFFD